MNLPRSKISRLWRRPAPPAAPVDVDPADMGTCFGLELSLDGTHPAPADAEPPASPNWWERRDARKAFGT